MQNKLLKNILKTFIPMFALIFAFFGVINPNKEINAAKTVDYNIISVDIVTIDNNNGYIMSVNKNNNTIPCYGNQTDLNNGDNNFLVVNNHGTEKATLKNAQTITYDTKDYSGNEVTINGNLYTITVPLASSITLYKNGDNFYTDAEHKKLANALLYTLDNDNDSDDILYYDGNKYNFSKSDDEYTINSKFITFNKLNNDNTLKEYTHEAVRISVGSPSNTYKILNMEIALNGTNINVNNRITINETDFYFTQNLHGLPASTIGDVLLNEFKTQINDDAIESISGLYQIQAETRQTAEDYSSFSYTKFYLITSEEYENINESVRFSYTEKIEATDATETYATKHYFNHTDVGTTLKDNTKYDDKDNDGTKDGNGFEFKKISKPDFSLLNSKIYYYKNGDNYEELSVDTESDYNNLSSDTEYYEKILSYPTISFNPEKYKVTYKRTLYSYIEYGEFIFENLNDTQATMTLLITQNGIELSRTTINIERTTASDKYNFEYIFTELGDYEIYKQCSIKTNGGFIFADINHVNLTNTNLLKTEALYIKGFQTVYVDNGETKYLKNDYYNSDFTNLNEQLIGENYKLSTLTMPSSVSILGNIITINNTSIYFDTDRVPSTNYANVRLKYNAKLNTLTNSSWYIYQSSTGSTIGIVPYNINTSFNAPGKYFVFLSFQDMSSNKGSTAQQFIVFEKTNSSPAISIKTTPATSSAQIPLNLDNAKELGSEDFTNKQVYVEYDITNPFNYPITIKYSRQNFNNNIEVNDIQCLGYITSEGNNDAELFSNEGRYTIKIIYNTNSYIIKTFTIDKTAISGITALSVNLSDKRLKYDTFDANVISNSTNFNLVTNKNFIWTWNKKASGASISAKYYYSEITSDNAITNSILNANNKEYVLTGDIFGSLIASQNYAYTEINKDNFKNGYTIYNSQIISTNRLCILLLEDQAGNTAFFITIFDNTSPICIQQAYNPVESKWENTNVAFISETMRFVWGDYKTLSIKENPEEGFNDVTDLLNNLDDSITINESTYAIPKNIQEPINKYFKKINEKQYYTLPIEQSINNPIEISLNNNSEDNSIEYNNTQIYVVIENNNEIYSVYLASPNSTKTASGSIAPKAKQLTLTGTSLLFQISNIHDILSNEAISTPKQVTLDKSLGTTYKTNEKYSNISQLDDATMRLIQTTENYVFNYNTINTNSLIFQFKQQIGSIFEVSTITLDYYELNYTPSENYPYSNTAIHTTLFSNTNNSDWKYDTENSIYTSITINPTADGKTQAGKYVITRTYVDSFNSSEIAEREGDVNNYTYIVYVDRTGIITKNIADAYETGEDIELHFGKETATYNSLTTYKTFFYSETSNEFNDSMSNYINITPSTGVETNILPTSLALELIDNAAYKYKHFFEITKPEELEDAVGYYYKDGNNFIKITSEMIEDEDFDYGKISNIYIRKYSSQLAVLVQAYYVENGKIEQTLYTSAINKIKDDTQHEITIAPINTLSSTEFKKAGTYRVVIMDLVNLQGTFKGNYGDLINCFIGNAKTVGYNPNYKMFSFTIFDEAPTAKAVIKGSSSVDSYTEISKTEFSGITYYYTNSNTLLLTFTDTTDIYRAKIDINNLILSKTIYSLTANGSKTSLVGQAKETLKLYKETDKSDYFRLFVQESTKESTKNNEINKTNFTLDELNIILGDAPATPNTLITYKIKIYGEDDSARYTYYIILPTMEEIEYKVDNDTYYYQNDCEYVLTYKYLGYTDYYNVNNGFGSTTLYVDHTAPFSNIVTLLHNDTYLSQTTKSTLYSNLYNKNYEYLTKQYAFAVGESFSISSTDNFKEQNTIYYRKYTIDKYSDNKYNSMYNNTFNNFSILNYGKTLTEIGYYDIIEKDASGNFRVYSIFISNSTNTPYFTATGNNATHNNMSYEITYNKITRQIDSFTSIVDKISIYSLTLESFTSDDLWYSIQYVAKNGNNGASYTILTISPETISANELILDTLQNFINRNILSGNAGKGCELEIVLKCRDGKDVEFTICTPASDLTINSLKATLISKNTFNITFPADTYSTQYSDFVITRNDGVLVNSNYIKTLKENRYIANTFTFEKANTKYHFKFKDNFDKSYDFIYPQTADLVNEIIFDGCITYNNMDYTPNSVIFRYTSQTTDTISLKITNIDTNEIFSINNYTFSKLQAAYGVSSYFKFIKTKGIVTMTFEAKANIHYTYEIVFSDVDNNISTYKFGIYTYAPTIKLQDISGINIWDIDDISKITSKTVIASWNEDNTYLFNPKVVLINNGKSTTITPGKQITNAGDYIIRVQNDLGTINLTSISFTIKEASSELYTVYYQGVQLSAHTQKYTYTLEGGSKININHYFFLSTSPTAWDNLSILPNEDKQLSYNLNGSNGNTRIFRVYGKVYETYFAVTQITNQNNNLTSFQIKSYTNKNATLSSNLVTTNMESLRLSPNTKGEYTYANISWETTYTDSLGERFGEFIYLDLWYNGTYIGRYISGNFNLTKSGKYTLKITNVVEQSHRFGQSSSSTTFTLTIINDIIYYINYENPITNATYNDSVTLSLIDINNYQWDTTGKIAVYKNNTLYTNYTQLTNTSWKFTETGYYKVELSTKTTAPEATIKATAYFTILDQNESLTIYDFAKMSGYSVKSIYRMEYNTYRAEQIQLFKNTLLNISTSPSDEEVEELTTIAQNIINSLSESYSNYEFTFDNIYNFETYLSNILINILYYDFVDITEDVKEVMGVSVLQNFKLTSENVGDGKYIISVNVNDEELSATLNYEFIIWINDVSPEIQSSRAFGSSSTRNVTISYNPSLLYQQVGNSYIMVNDTLVATINAESESDNAISKYTFSAPGTYLVQVYSKSGTLLSSQRITINVPLNTATIILIIVGCLVVIGIIVTFILLRTKMRIK